MWRVAAACVGTMLGGCNALLGIHDLGGDVPADAPTNPTGPRDGQAHRDAPSPCYLPTSLGTPAFAAGEQGAVVDRPTVSTPDTDTYWYGLGGVGAGQFQLEIGALSGGGSTGTDATPDWPTSLDAKSGLDFATSADVYATLLTEIGSDGTSHLFYVAEAGSLSLTQAGSAVGATFAGTIADVGFVHVDVDDTGTITGDDPDNCATAIPSFAFSGTVALDSSSIARSSARQPIRATGRE